MGLFSYRKLNTFPKSRERICTLHSVITQEKYRDICINTIIKVILLFSLYVVPSNSLYADKMLEY